MNSYNQLKCAVLLALFASNTYADEVTDAKIARLQKMLEVQQVQMKAIADELKALQKQAPIVVKNQNMPAPEEQKLIQEQQWQIQAMSEELNALQQKPSVVVNEKDGIGLKSNNGDFSIKLHGLLQADYRNSSGAITSTNGWLIRKARPWIEGSLFGWIDYKLTPEFATTTNNIATAPSSGGAVTGSTTLGTPEVIDAYADFKFKPWLKLRAGKFKPFVGLARLQADSVGKFLEQSYVTANLLPQRDVGAAVFGDLWEGKLSYAIGYSNGVIDGGDQSVALDNNTDKEISARIFAEPFKGQDSVLAGLGVGIAGTKINQRGSSTSSQLPSYRGFSQNSFFTYLTGSTVNGAQNAYANGDRIRLSPQMYYYYGPFGLMAEYAHEAQEVSRGLTTRSLRHDAWEITTSYLLTGEKASFGDVKPNQAFKPGTDGWGAWEIVARYNEMYLDNNTFAGSTSATANTANNALADITKSAKSAKGLGIGLNWYLNNATRFSVDYEHASFDGGAIMGDKPSEDTMIGRLQVSF
ncbi:MAG: porin [Methylophilaceae bacterium]